MRPTDITSPELRLSIGCSLLKTVFSQEPTDRFGLLAPFFSNSAILNQISFLESDFSISISCLSLLISHLSLLISGLILLISCLSLLISYYYLIKLFTALQLFSLLSGNFLLPTSAFLVPFRLIL